MSNVSIWQVIDEAMSYRQRISGWWLYNIIMISMFVGGLIGKYA